MSPARSIAAATIQVATGFESPREEWDSEMDATISASDITPTEEWSRTNCATDAGCAGR